MKALKSSVLLAASTAARLLSALYTVKITAVTLAPSGIGVIGQFNNLLLIATTLAGGGIASGIVKAVAGAATPIEEIQRKLGSAHGFACVCTAIIFLAVFLCNEQLALLLPIKQGGLMLLMLAVGQYGLFQIAALTALVNSNGRQDLFAISSLASGVTSAILVTVGCVYFGLAGTLLGMLAGALSQFLFLHILAKRSLPRLSTLAKPRLVHEDLGFWMHFSMLSVITVIGMPLAQISIRNALVTAAGWDTVGIWQAMVRLSDAYLQFGLLYLSAIYYPRLAATPTMAACKAVILNYARLVLPAVAIVFTCIYLLRFQIVPLLFSAKFIQVTELFMPQLIGDAFKISSYFISYAFLATGRYKLSMCAELAQAGLFWTFATRFGMAGGALGVAWSYAATYFVYFILIAITFALLSAPKQANPSILGNNEP